MTGRAAQKAESIKLVALDVDGVMTDGTLFYRAMSEPETKPFNIKDGLGIKKEARGIKTEAETIHRADKPRRNGL